MVAPSSATFQRPDLGSAFQELSIIAQNNGFIGMDILPAFETPLATANFSVIPVDQLLQQRDTTRAPGAGYSRGTYTFEQASFTTIEYGAEEPVGDRERSIYSYSFDLERVAAERAVGFVMRQHEQQVADAIMDTSTFANSAAGTTWATSATATPIANVFSAIKSVRTQSGLEANCVVMDLNLFLDLKACEEVIDRVKYGGGNEDPANISAQALAEIFGVEKVLVSRGSKNTAQQGQAASLSGIFNNTRCFVGRVSTGLDLRDACVGRTFLNTNDGAGSLVLEQYRDEPRRADIIRARLDFDAKIIYADAGHIITGCA